MESRQLRYFVAVAEHGSFTAAAKALHIAQPALSISIKKFEQQLEVELFRREDRQIALTNEGVTLFEHAKRILQQLDDAQLAVDELKGLEKGEVKLGAPSMMGSYFFPEVLMAFKSHYPNLKLTLIDAGTRSIRQMLLDGELDLGVIVSEDVIDELETDHLLEAEMVAVVGKQHSLAEKTVMDFQTFFEQELVMFKPGYFHREFIESKAKKHGYKMDFSFETNLLPMILSIVKHEFAITSLLTLVTDNEPEVKGISFEQPVTFNLVLAWRKDGYLSKADQTFIEFVKRYV